MGKNFEHELEIKCDTDRSDIAAKLVGYIDCVIQLLMSRSAEFISAISCPHCLAIKANKNETTIFYFEGKI